MKRLKELYWFARLRFELWWCINIRRLNQHDFDVLFKGMGFSSSYHPNQNGYTRTYTQGPYVIRVEVKTNQQTN
jgi:hypothetical protein